MALAGYAQPLEALVQAGEHGNSVLWRLPGTSSV